MKRCVAIMALLLSLACTRDTDMAGTYAGSYSGLSGAVRVVMVLNADGSGKWEIGGEAMPFVWLPHEDTVTVHSKEGGVVEGRLEQHGLNVHIPGIGNVLLERREGL